MEFTDPQKYEACNDKTMEIRRDIGIIMVNMLNEVKCPKYIRIYEEVDNILKSITYGIYNKSNKVRWLNKPFTLRMLLKLALSLSFPFHNCFVSFGQKFIIIILWKLS